MAIHNENGAEEIIEAKNKEQLQNCRTTASVKSSSSSPCLITLLATTLTALTHDQFTAQKRHAIGLHFTPFVTTSQTRH